VLHGYIDPEDYRVEDYTSRYADWLAEAGYYVFHPNYRNHPPSDEGENPFRIGYSLDTLNLMAIIRAQSLDPTSTLRRADGESIHLMGHSMGGGIAWRVITVRPEWVDAVAFYGSMNADEALNFEKIQEWTNGDGGDFELESAWYELEAISPIYHLRRSYSVPVEIHHGARDTTVPVEWSVEACERLQQYGFTVQCFTYNLSGHTFYGASENLFMERLIDFFNRY
jgi:dienelactone hydrolase